MKKYLNLQEKQIAHRKVEAENKLDNINKNRMMNRFKNFKMKYLLLFLIICLSQFKLNGQNISNCKRQKIRIEYEQNASPEIFKKMRIYKDTTFKGTCISFETGFINDSILVYFNNRLIFSKSITTNDSQGLAGQICTKYKNLKDYILIIINNKTYIHHLVNKKYDSIKLRKENDYWVLIYTNNVSSYE